MGSCTVGTLYQWIGWSSVGYRSRHLQRFCRVPADHQRHRWQPGFGAGEQNLHHAAPELDLRHRAAPREDLRGTVEGTVQGSSVRQNRSNSDPHVNSRTGAIHLRRRLHSYVRIYDWCSVRAFLPVGQLDSDHATAVHRPRDHPRHVEVEDRSGQLGHPVPNGAGRSAWVEPAGARVPVHPVDRSPVRGTHGRPGRGDRHAEQLVHCCRRRRGQ